MAITRRHFLLSTAGAAAGAILPSFYFRALEFVERFGEPMLEYPTCVDADLHVINVNGHYLELFLGEPFVKPPVWSHREYAEYQGYEIGSYIEDYGVLPEELDEPICEEKRFEFWAQNDSPGARAFSLLGSLDLGDELAGPDAVGGIEFLMWYPCLSVVAPDLVSLSLLQKRLNDLGTHIRLKPDYAMMPVEHPYCI